MTLQEERRQWEEQATAEAISNDVTALSEVISAVPCLWLHSKTKESGGKIIFYLHGGGLTSGSALTHRNFVARIVEATGESALIVDYRLLPENEFPAPLDDALAVYCTLINGDGFSSENIIIGGDSSGGGLALSTIIQLRNRGIKLPSKLFTISGVFDMTMSGDSMKVDPGKEPFLTLEGLKNWQNSYFKDFKSPLLSPYFSELSGIPPTLIMVGKNELWLSDSIRTHEKLMRFGNKTKLKVWESMTHVWPMDSSLNESQEALIEIRDFISN